MFITFNTLSGNLNCLPTRRVKQESVHLVFSHNGSKLAVPIQDLISIQEVPDLPKVAFIPDYLWKETINNLLKDFNVIWHDEYLYCHFNDCLKIQKILFDTGESEMILSELPIEDYYFNR